MSNQSSVIEAGSRRLENQATGGSTGQQGLSDNLSAEELRKRRQAYFERYVQHLNSFLT